MEYIEESKRKKKRKKSHIQMEIKEGTYKQTKEIWNKIDENRRKMIYSIAKKFKDPSNVVFRRVGFYKGEPVAFVEVYYNKFDLLTLGRGFILYGEDPKYEDRINKSDLINEAIKFGLECKYIN